MHLIKSAKLTRKLDAVAGIMRLGALLHILVCHGLTSLSFYTKLS